MKVFKYIVISVFVILACKNSGEPFPENKLGIKDLEFDSNTNIVGDFNAQVNFDTTGNRLIIDQNVFDNEPKTNQIILIPGQYMRKVVSVSKSGNKYQIETTDATLPEVVKNGSFKWSLTPEWSDQTQLVVNGSPAARVKSIQDNVIEYQFAAKDIDYKISIEPTAVQGKISACKIQTQMVKKTAGRPNVSFIAEGNFTMPQQETEIEIKDGKLSSFSSNNKGISGTINLSIQAADGEPGETSQLLPSLALSFPIRVIPTPFGVVPNPIPMSIDVGVQFVSSIKRTGSTTSATAKNTIKFDADGGFRLEKDKVNSSGKVNNQSITNGVFDAAGFIGSEVDVQFGIAFPRVSLKIASQEVAYVHVGFTTGSKIQWGPLCKSGYAKLVVEGGYGLKVLGSTLFGQKQTFDLASKEAKGDGCN